MRRFGMPPPDGSVRISRVNQHRISRWSHKINKLLKAVMGTKRRVSSEIEGHKRPRIHPARLLSWADIHKAGICGPKASSTCDPTIGDYLIRRLLDYGVGHVFGVPGDYILTLLELMDASPLKFISCVREDAAGMAADAYGRLHGMGVLAVTYGVGALSACNSIAEAFAEESPLVVISGAPGLVERCRNPMLHHKVRNYETQRQVLEPLCVAVAVLEDPATARYEIDRVLHAAATFHRPVYLEIPRNLVLMTCPVGIAYQPLLMRSNPQALESAVKQAVDRLNASHTPIIIVGVEVSRFALQERLLRLIEDCHLPFCTTILGKSALPEDHPLCLGVYQGAMSRESTTRFVEDSDCVMLVGVLLTELNLGMDTARIRWKECILVDSRHVSVGGQPFDSVVLGDFVREVHAHQPRPHRRYLPATIHPKHAVEATARITMERTMALLDERLDDHTMVVADLGESLFASADLTTHSHYIANAYYGSTGFSIPAALGASLASPGQRVVVLVGDGAFQQTSNELSTMIRYGVGAIVVILDNHGYGTLQCMESKRFEYNRVHLWKYRHVPAVLGSGTGYLVKTEGDLVAALDQAWHSDRLSIVDVHLSQKDRSRALQRLAEVARTKVEAAP